MFKFILPLTFMMTSLFSFSGTEYERLMKQIEVGYNKNIILIISSTGCKYCEKQKKIIDDDENIRKVIFDKFSNYFEINKDEVALPDSLYVQVTPAIIIISPEHAILAKSYGYKTAEELDAYLDEYEIDDINETLSLNSYHTSYISFK